MKHVVQKISLSMLTLSVLSYVIGRTWVRDIVTDDVGDWFLWSGGVASILLFFTSAGSMRFDFRAGINIIVACMIVLFTAFGLWGLVASSGQRQYREMAALIPFYALVAAGVLLAVLVILNLLWRKNMRRKKG